MSIENYIRSRGLTPPSYKTDYEYPNITSRLHFDPEKKIVSDIDKKQGDRIGGAALGGIPTGIGMLSLVGLMPLIAVIILALAAAVAAAAIGYRLPVWNELTKLKHRREFDDLATNHVTSAGYSQELDPSWLVEVTINSQEDLDRFAMYVHSRRNAPSTAKVRYKGETEWRRDTRQINLNSGCLYRINGSNKVYRDSRLDEAFSQLSNQAVGLQISTEHQTRAPQRLAVNVQVIRADQLQDAVVDSRATEVIFVDTTGNQTAFRQKDYAGQNISHVDAANAYLEIERESLSSPSVTSQAQLTEGEQDLVAARLAEIRANEPATVSSRQPNPLGNGEITTEDTYTLLHATTGLDPLEKMPQGIHRSY